MKKGITRVAAPKDLTAIFPYIMKRRCDSQVFFHVDLCVDPLLAWVKEKQNCTFFQALLLALIKTMRARPKLNRFIAGRRLYQRDDLEVCFIARRSFDEEGTETSIKVRVKPDDDDSAILSKISGEIKSAKEGNDKSDDQAIAALLKLPRFLLRIVVNFLIWTEFYMIFPKYLEKIDPLHCSAYVANLGSVGIEAPFHHLFEWGTCSLFVAIGKAGPKLTLDEDNNPVVKTMVEIKVTLDERIADGYYYARSLDLFKNLVEHPEVMFDEK